MGLLVLGLCDVCSVMGLVLFGTWLLVYLEHGSFSTCSVGLVLGLCSVWSVYGTCSTWNMAVGLLGAWLFFYLERGSIA